MSDEEEQAEEVEDLAATADLSFDDIRRVLNKPEKQVPPAAATRASRRRRARARWGCASPQTRAAQLCADCTRRRVLARAARGQC